MWNIYIKILTMQKFYRDKSKLFECNISVDGANLNETKARLVLEFPNDRNLLFYGKIKDNGKCEITIPALKEFEESNGNVILEVIADSTYFESWRDTFNLETNKKVTVEMVEKEENIITEKKITPHVQIFTSKEEKKSTIVEPKKEQDKVNNLMEFKSFIDEKKVNITEVLKNKEKYLKLLMEFKKDKVLTKSDVLKLHEEITAHYVNKLI